MLELETYFTYRKSFLIILVQIVLYTVQIFLAQDKVKYIYTIMIMISFFHFELRYILISIFFILSLCFASSIIEIHPLNFLIKKILKSHTNENEEIKLNADSSKNHNLDIKDKLKDIAINNMKNSNTVYPSECDQKSYDFDLNYSHDNYPDVQRYVDFKNTRGKSDKKGFCYQGSGKNRPSRRVSNCEEYELNNELDNEAENFNHETENLKRTHYNQEKADPSRFFEDCEKNVNLSDEFVKSKSISNIISKNICRNTNSGTHYSMKKNKKTDNNKLNRLSFYKNYREKFKKYSRKPKIINKKSPQILSDEDNFYQNQNSLVSNRLNEKIVKDKDKNKSDNSIYNIKILNISEKSYSQMRFTIHEWSFVMSNITDMQNDIKKYILTKDQALQKKYLERIFNLFKHHILFSSVEGGFIQVIEEINNIINKNENKMSVKYIYLEDDENTYFINCSYGIKEEKLIVIDIFDQLEITDDIIYISDIMYERKKENIKDNELKIYFFLD